MAFGNTELLGQIATSTASTAALVTDKAITKEWANNQALSHPLIAKIKENGANWNAGFIPQSNAVILPLIGGLGTASNTYAGCARSSELTPMTANTTDGLTGARYLWAYHRGNITYKPSELKLIKDGDRGNLIDARIKQFLEVVRQRYSTDVASATNGSDSKVLGLLYALSGSSATALGGIDASDSLNSWFRANYTSATGTLTETLLRKEINKASINNAKLDMMLASNGGGSAFDTFEKVMSFVAPQERIVNLQSKMAKYGFNSFSYRNIEVFMDYWLGTGGNNGELLLLDSSSWFWGGSIEPDMSQDEQLRIQGTGGIERFYEEWNFLGVNQPRVNTRLAGITG